MSRANQWFLPGEGIAREVVTADIQRYLGPEALVRPGSGIGEWEGRPGFWITAYRNLTSQMIEDLKDDTARWRSEENRSKSRLAYQDSVTHAARQHWQLNGLNGTRYSQPEGYPTQYSYSEYGQPSYPATASYYQRSTYDPDPRGSAYSLSTGSTTGYYRPEYPNAFSSATSSPIYQPTRVQPPVPTPSTESVSQSYRYSYPDPYTSDSTTARDSRDYDDTTRSSSSSAPTQQRYGYPTSSSYAPVERDGTRPSREDVDHIRPVPAGYAASTRPGREFVGYPQTNRGDQAETAGYVASTLAQKPWDAGPTEIDTTGYPITSASTGRLARRDRSPPYSTYTTDYTSRPPHPESYNRYSPPPRRRTGYSPGPYSRPSPSSPRRPASRSPPGQSQPRHEQKDHHSSYMNNFNPFSNSAEGLAYDCGWQRGGELFCNGPAQTVLEKVNELGRGAVGLVDEVRCVDYSTSPHFVRKTVRIPVIKRQAQIYTETVQKEIEHLKLASHPHVVKVIGSYKEEVRSRTLISVLMFPVGERNLMEFFEVCSSNQEDGNAVALTTYHLWLKSWFGCLISTLTHMHSIGIQHKDIKPHNIIHRQGHVYFTDFSSSRRFELNESTSTSDFARDTRLYRAPEASRESDQTHGSRADVFSLGLVFIEMLAVLLGKRISDLRNDMDEIENDFGEYWRIVGHFDRWFGEQDKSSTVIGSGNRNWYEMYSNCIKPMLIIEKEGRPRAVQIKRLVEQYQRWEVGEPCPCKHSSAEPMDLDSSFVIV